MKLSEFKLFLGKLKIFFKQKITFSKIEILKKNLDFEFKKSIN